MGIIVYSLQLLAQVRLLSSLVIQCNLALFRPLCCLPTSPLIEAMLSGP